MPAPVDFLRTARDQARELQRRFVAHLMLHRRTQTRVSVLLAGVLTLTVIAAARAASPAGPNTPAGTCSPSSVPRPEVPADWRVVALPRDMIVPQMEPGDRVDVVAQAEVIALDAVVVSAPTDTEGLVVAVPPAAAATVATSAQTGDVSVIGHG